MWELIPGFCPKLRRSIWGLVYGVATFNCIARLPFLSRILFNSVVNQILLGMSKSFKTPSLFRYKTTQRQGVVSFHRASPSTLSCYRLNFQPKVWATTKY